MGNIKKGKGNSILSCRR